MLNEGLVFKHEYDYGSTTVLRLQVVGKYSGSAVEDKITLLARNNEREYICERCGEKADYIVTDGDMGDYTPLQPVHIRS